MESLGSAPPTQETIDKLRSLHPDDPNGDHPIPDALKREGEEWARGVIIDDDDVLKAVSSAPKNKSEDLFGWRAEHIAPLLKYPDSLNALTTIFTLICRGSLPDLAAEAFCSGRLVALLKPDPGGLRPIGIPLIFRRLAGRIYNARSKDNLQHLFIGLDGRVVQFALGRPCGPQAMSVAMQELLKRNPTWIIISLDVKNAFNSLSRLAMARGVANSVMRNSFAFFHMCYNKPTEMIYHAAGKMYTVMSKSGATQGTSDGMQHYCLGSHPMLVEAAAPHPDVHILSDAPLIPRSLVRPTRQSLRCATWGTPSFRTAST